MIETSYMKFGKGPSGIIGKTTKPKTIQIWAKSQLSCSEVLQILDAIRNKAENTMSTKKEEWWLIKLIRSNLKSFLKLATIHLIETTIHIYTGQTSEKKVNVNKAVEIGEKQMTSFHSSLPDSFRSTIKKEVVTMKTSGKAAETKKAARGIQHRDNILKRHVFAICWPNPD